MQVRALINGKVAVMNQEVEVFWDGFAELYVLTVPGRALGVVSKPSELIMNLRILKLRGYEISFDWYGDDGDLFETRFLRELS